ncbi:cytochrome P450 [Dactylonectria estremocensis]|uniref:Cytochrome P450 n=1 Tax=Dactylonectria estremocensis TaxID=1079267 RepID=A0A9P9EKU4_9HYPO|nr:cytochrome P450 [Dactylonectria estremocensis]
MLRTQFPGPFIAKINRWQLIYHELRGKREEYLLKLHHEHGPVVQIGPKVLSVNSYSGLQQIFSASNRLSRPEPLPFLHNYKSENLVTTVDGDLHYERRKVLRTVYSASVIDSPDFQRILQDSVDDFLAFISKHQGPVDIRIALRRLAYRVMSHVVYGSSHAANIFQTDSRHGPETDVGWEKDTFKIPSTLFMLYFPYLTLWLRRMNFAPSSIDGSTPSKLVLDRVGRQALQALESDMQGLKSDTDDVPSPQTLIHHLYHTYATEGSPASVPSRDYILSDCFDHFWAGVETTVNALTPMLKQVSFDSNRHHQSRLQEEIRKLMTSKGSTLSTKELKQARFLDAVIRETLRTNPPIGFSLERHAPANDNSISLGGKAVPASWTVGASPLVVGHNTSAFHEPRDWLPERWMNRQEEGLSASDKKHDLAIMKRHFFAFGSGPRMCVGINVAWAVMRAAMAGIYGRYDTELAHSTTGNESGYDILKDRNLKVIFRKIS